MKKLLATLGVIAMVGSTAATLVACGGGLNTDPVTGDKIWLITDAGKIADKSFNQSGKEGGDTFNKDILEINESIKFTEPNTLNDLEAAYTNAKLDGAATLILPGFHHAVEGENLAPQIMNGGTTIILDSDNGGYDNQIGIMFRGDISGFLAAFGGMVQLSNNPDFAGKTIKMSTFGGVHNAGAVDNFMVGFLAAIDVFNDVKKNEALATSLGIGDKAINFERLDTQKNGPAADNDAKWFTNSFGAGDANQITDNMLGEGAGADAQIIMPVAGPQTADVLTKMSAKDPDAKKLFVVGVDTDQATQYTTEDGNVQDRFISSAQKPLVESTVIALGHSQDFVEKTDVQDKTVAYATKTNSSFTVENENGEYDSYDLSENKAESWEGKTMWMGGKAAIGGLNQLTSETLEEMNEITTAMLEDASKELFVKINKDGTAKNILSNATVKAYADSIINALNSK